MKKFLFPVLYFLLVVVFFYQFIFKGLLPIPTDTIVGMYYPFRDVYAKTNPNGIPFKNHLITDPVRQLYPWKHLAVENIKEGHLPLWNPYNFSGTPLVANFQSSVFYPFNFLFFIMPFEYAFSFLIFLQPLLAGFFLYMYLRNQGLKESPSFIGAFSFSFSGFFIAWLEWGTVLHTALYLPLVLLSIDKLFFYFSKKGLFNKSVLSWSIVFILSLVFSFLAGHLQTFFYLAIFVLLYVISKLILANKKFRNLIFLIFLFILFLIITFIQWFPTVNFINLSARSLDIVGFNSQGWFIPWQNLIQFIAPDFFGNPSTLNYFGIWNYAEFIGYIGIIPLIFALFALFFRKDKKTLFFGTIFFISLIFALPTVFAKLPYKFELPFISTSQPTRLLFITDFCLSVLAALGFDYFSKRIKRINILYIFGFIFLLFILLWSFVLFFNGGLISSENLNVAKHNLILPSLIFLASLIAFLAIIIYSQRKKEKASNTILFSLVFVIITISVFDLFRFGLKFETFAKKDYLYPKTEITSFLQKQKGPFRTMSSDSTILPPNFSIMYKLQTLDGYDPLYLQRYAEFMAAMGRGKPDISPPFGFNRIITPQNVSSRLVDFLNVKYVLSKNKLDEPKLNLVFKNGSVFVYENTKVFPRAFFVINTKLINSKQEAINVMFDEKIPLSSVAVVENVGNKDVFKNDWSMGKVEVLEYGENKVILKTTNNGDGFLVLTDSYYPSWKATIDNRETKIYLTDYNYRGIIVPKGEHKIEFTNSLF